MPTKVITAREDCEFRRQSQWSGSRFMSAAPVKKSRKHNLERTIRAMESISHSLALMESHLTSFENSHLMKDLISAGEYIVGNLPGVICIPSTLKQGDPLQPALNQMKTRGYGMPSIIRLDDSMESVDTCDKVVRIIRSEVLPSLDDSSFVVNLRCDEMISPFESNRTIVIGRRYSKGSKKRFKRLERTLGELGVSVLSDKGEYGGGPLVYAITRALPTKTNLLIFELTLSMSVAKEPDIVAQILESLQKL
ncbi:MAG: hypothetical protein ACTSPR_02475 [Candidatus Thorarchaeota archaeon]